MQDLHELSPESVLVEPRKADKKPRLTKDPDKATFNRLAALAEELGFDTPETTALSNGSLAPTRDDPKELGFSVVIRGADEPVERRAGRPFQLAHEQSKDFLSVENINRVHRDYDITPFIVRKSVFWAFWSRSSVLLDWQD